MLATARLQTVLCVSDIDRARQFYADLLGLSIKREMFNGLMFDVGGADLMVAPVPDPTPSSHTVIGLAVSDVAAIVTKLAKRGLITHRESHLTYDEAGIATAPDGSRVAWYRDPDGNFLSVVQYPGG